PFGGLDDLAAYRLRTPLSPVESFTDDPLRMLRAARFISGYHFLADNELVAAVKELRGRLEIVSPERIRGELDKLLVVESPEAGRLHDKLNSLTRCDCTTPNQPKAAELARRMDLLEQRIAALKEQEELDRVRPDLDGNEIMEHLGIGPGPAVGKAWKYLYELR